MIVFCAVSASAAGYSGWYQYKGAYYYLENYTPLKGFQKIGGTRYYFNKNTGTLEGYMVHHDAVYETVHHDAVTHEEPVFSTVHHDAVTSQVWIEDTPADSVCVYDGVKCQWCEAIFTTRGECAALSLEAHDGQAGCEDAYHWETVPATGHYETVVTAEAWDETVVSSYTTVTDTLAWEEQVVDTPAWDEYVTIG